MTNSVQPQPEQQFNEVVELITQAKSKAVQAVNQELVSLYWRVGAYISRKLNQAEWGDNVVGQLADYLSHTQPSLRGFTRRNLFRMRQFYEAYQGDTIVTPLVTQLPDRALLEAKLQEFYTLNMAEKDND